MNKLPNHTSLKEWSSVIDTIGRGDQVILIRKGGIADADFGLEAQQFYLYPTYFHQGESDHRAGVSVTHWCEVARMWRIRDIDSLYRLAPQIAMPRETLEARYRFRPDQALHVIGVRTFRLAKPVEVKFREAYAGCRSWLSVDDEIDTAGSTAALSENELTARLDAIDSLLSVTV